MAERLNSTIESNALSRRSSSKMCRSILHAIDTSPYKGLPFDTLSDTVPGFAGGSDREVTWPTDPKVIVWTGLSVVGEAGLRQAMLGKNGLCS